jgi:hypothetical protein
MLPLHIFEERYRGLMRSIIERPDGERREFGVVAIRRGWEVEQASSTVSLYDVGCTAEVRRSPSTRTGRSTSSPWAGAGSPSPTCSPSTPRTCRRRCATCRRTRPEGDAEMLAPRVLAAFGRYLRLVRVNAADIPEQLPEDPHVLSHLVAATPT